jgi:hypothetical protein
VKAKLKSAPRSKRRKMVVLATNLVTSVAADLAKD